MQSFINQRSSQDSFGTLPPPTLAWFSKILARSLSRSFHNSTPVSTEWQKTSAKSFYPDMATFSFGEGGEEIWMDCFFLFYFLFHFNKPKPSGIYKIETSRQTCWRRQEPSCDSQRFAGRFINFNAMILADSTTPSSFSRISSSFKARLKRITMPAAWTVSTGKPGDGCSPFFHGAGEMFLWLITESHYTGRQ